MSLASRDLKLLRNDIPRRYMIPHTIKRKIRALKRRKMREAVVSASAPKLLNNIRFQRSNPFSRFQRGRPLQNIASFNQERRNLITSSLNNPGSSSTLKMFTRGSPRLKPRLIPKRQGRSSVRSTARRQNLQRSNLTRKTKIPLSPRSVPGKRIGKVR